MTNQIKVALCAIYQRKAETNNDESDDSNSIQNQKSMLLQYALSKGGKFTIFIVMTIIQVQTDADQLLISC